VAAYLLAIAILVVYGNCVVVSWWSASDHQELVSGCAVTASNDAKNRLTVVLE